MYIFLTIVHIIVSLGLIAVVLLQSGKGAEMGASFGASGSQSVFGAGGGSTFMSKMTTGAAIIFMLTSLTLAYLSSRPGGSSIMSSKVPAQTAPQMPAQGQPATVPAKPSEPAKQMPAPPAPVAPKK
jgi:preprotein translocase subunit SecG